MSGSNPATITTASPPTTAEVAADFVAWIGGQSGVLTDFNLGSQVRTDAEAMGSVIELQATIAQAQAFQAMIYSAWAAFNVFPRNAIPANGAVTFITGSGANPPPVPFQTVIPAGTIVQTGGGIQFQTIQNVTMNQGDTSANALIAAIDAGSTSNVPAGSIIQLVSALPIPLQVNNANATTGGEDAETPPQVMARFTSIVASLGRADPVSVANAPIGVSTGNETVAFATCFEPWIQMVSQGIAPPYPAGFQVYIDNGTGAASASLIAAAKARLDGDLAGGQEGYRPAGVPYDVFPVQPVFATVVVSGTALVAGLAAGLVTLATDAITSYFTGLGFGENADFSILLPLVANQVAGNLNSLSVTMLDASGVAQTSIAPPGTGRVILQSAAVNIV